ncbi:MAG: DUF4349 domain-containing protein [Acidimicrobiia bacterium]|nr:DUF4349 domain-containing protein [Acidimicrobiia bacterium]
MNTTRNLRHPGAWRILLLVIVASTAIAACSSADTASSPTVGDFDIGVGEGGDSVEPENLYDADRGAPSADGIESSVTSAKYAEVYDSVGAPPFEAKVIRDGRIDVRIGEGTFDARGSEIRAIAAELGGYVSSGESHIEEYDENRYAVGWFTLRIPSDRFDDAVARVEGLGERVSSSLSSQDVSDQYVDLEGRLKYWRQQEAFYTGLLAEAQDIDDLVTIQVQMQDVLLNIEQIEGQLQYLDGRTSYATLTVGLTEVPDVVAPIVEPTSDPGPIEEAFDQAGEVLLATVAFLIVAAAVIIPIGILVLIAWLIVRLFTPRRKDQPAEG